MFRIKYQEAFSYKPNADTSHLLDSLVSALAVYATAFRSKLSLLSINFACLPRETGKARAFEIDLRHVEANLSTNEEGKISNKYMQKEILHRNRK